MPSCRTSCSDTPPTCCRSCSSSAVGTTSGAASPDAAYTKLVGAGLLFACVSSFLSLAFGTLRVAPRDVPLAARSENGWRLSSPIPEQDRIDHPDPDAAVSLDRSFHAILVRPALRRAFPAGPGSGRCPDREQQRSTGRKPPRKQRQEVLKKHLDKTGKDTKVEGRAASTKMRGGRPATQDPLESEGSSNEGGSRRTPPSRHAPPPLSAPPPRHCERLPPGRLRRRNQASDAADRTDASVVGSREGPGREETQRRLCPAAAGAA